MRKIGQTLSANSNNIHSAIVSQIPCGLSSLIEYHFFSEPRPMNDHCPSPIQIFSCVVFSSTRNFVEHQHKQNSSCEILWCLAYSGVSPNLNSKLLTSSLSCNVLNPWKIFHSNSIGSPSILSKFLYVGEDFNHPNLCFQASLDSGC